MVTLPVLHSYAFFPLDTLQDHLFGASLTLIVFIVFYCWWVLLQNVFPSYCKIKNRHQGNTDYRDIHTPKENETPATEPETPKGEIEDVYARPRLYMQDVWTLVYGLGFAYFILNYVVTCQFLLALQFLGYALFLVVPHELANQKLHLMAPNSILYCSAAVLTLVGLVIRGAENGYVHIAQPIIHRKLIEIMFDMIFPLCIAFVLVDVKKQHRYSIGGLFEVCEFGLPFACICSALVVVCYASEIPVFFLKHSLQHPGIYLTLIISPIVFFFTVMLVMQSVIHSHIVDLLIAVNISSNIYGLMINDDESARLMMYISLSLAFVGGTLRFAMFTDFIQKKQSKYMTSVYQQQGSRMRSVLEEDDIESIQT